MKRSLSVTKGKGSIGHNSRAFKAENVDAERSQFNTCYINEDLQDVYHKLFDDSLAKYNAKQKRNDSKIPDYYEKIRIAKQEKLFYEIVVQVGKMEDMPTETDNGKLAEKILDQYMRAFIERNNSLYVFSAHLHMDEATPHLHIDFIPYSTSDTRGLETKNSLKGAIEQLGFKGGTRRNTELEQWQDSERQHLAEVMLQYGIEWEKQDNKRDHLSVLDFKKEKRTEEVAELEEVVANLEDKTADLTSNIVDIEKQTKKAESKLKNLKKQEKMIDNNVYKYDEDEEWQLPEPTLLMTASTYKDKKAKPLVGKLKSVIKSLIIQMVQMTGVYNKAVDMVKRLENQVKKLTSQVEKSKEKAEKYELLEKNLGKYRIDGLIKEYQNTEPIIEAVHTKKTREVR